MSNVGKPGSSGDHLGPVKTDEVRYHLVKLRSCTRLTIVSWKSQAHTFSCRASISLDVCVSVRACMGLARSMCVWMSVLAVLTVHLM